MSNVPDNFYHLMLGLPADVGAPDHYELLGLQRFDDDIRRIHEAAIDRNRQLLSWQNSEFHGDADRLMDEIVAARAVLSDPRQKFAYDRQLGRSGDAARDVTSALQTSRPVTVPLPEQAAAISSEPEPQARPREAVSFVFAALRAQQRRAWQQLIESPIWAEIDRRVRLSRSAALFRVLVTGGAGLLALLVAGWLLARNLLPSSIPEATPEQQAWAQALGKASHVEQNSVGMDLVLIPPGKFTMGENSQVLVTLTQPFYVGRTEVTQGQWQAVMDMKPWAGSEHQEFVKEDANGPATHVSWSDAQEFCRRLGKIEGVTYRLPTEAEWEFACRAGTSTKYHCGDSETELAKYAWFDVNTSRVRERYAHKVGQKRPNPFCLYDMHGNVREWCEDRFNNTLPGGDNPLAKDTGSSYSYRVTRGGSWGMPAPFCRSTDRGNEPSGSQEPHLGFRVAMALPNVVTQSSESSAPPSPTLTPSAQPPVPPAAASVPPSLAAPFTATEAQAAQQAWASVLGNPSRGKQNSIGMNLILIPPGTFLMGSPDGDPEAQSNEKPQVVVTLTQPFYVSRTEVTQREWQAVMNTTPWKGQSNIKDEASCPATPVSWVDAQEFCKRLSAKEGLTYRLPTEAEWEYACRAGTTTTYYFGDSESELGDYAWFTIGTSKSGGRYAREVAQKQPNPFGLYDMHGNVMELCEDAYVPKLPGGNNPLSKDRSTCVNRGGGWTDYARACRSAYRGGVSPGSRFFGLGFRVVEVPPRL